jgi:hypothetical protein
MEHDDGLTEEARAAHTLRGLPQSPHDGLTPLGEIEQFGKIADGLRAPREGWRKWVVRIGLVMIGAAFVVVVLAQILQH